VRITGGEPTSRPDIIEIIHRLASVPELCELAMTTNGLTLARQARDLARAGLARVNVSLDSLDAGIFRRMTGVNGLASVIEGIDAAVLAGLSPVKLNTVVVRGENEENLPALLDFAATRALELRFIELMAMGPLAENWSQRYVSVADIKRMLAPHIIDWRPIPSQVSSSARRFRARLRDGREATVGFITPMSCNFCSDCNRIRIGENGRIYPCLMGPPSGSVLEAIRPRFDPSRLDELIQNALAGKAAEHPVKGFGIMTQIGG